MTPSEKFARLLLTKVRGDLAAAVTLANDEAMNDEVVGFHCQQAVEKSLKSVLAENDVDFPNTHDLAELTELLNDIEVDGPISTDDIGYLKPWAVELRYDILFDQRIDRSRVVGAANAAVTWASDCIGA